MPQVGFEPTISAGERPQIHALDRAATGTGSWNRVQDCIAKTSDTTWQAVGNTCLVCWQRKACEQNRCTKLYFVCFCNAFNALHFLPSDIGFQYRQTSKHKQLIDTQFSTGRPASTNSLSTYNSTTNNCINILYSKTDFKISTKNSYLQLFHRST